MSLARYTRKLGPLLLSLCAVFAAPGCSLVYDPDVFAEPVDPPDAEPPGPDVDFTALDLTDIQPDTVVEGAGCLPEDEGCAAGSRGVPIVVNGIAIAPDATVTIDGAGFVNAAVDATIATDSGSLAFVVAIPVKPALPSGMSETITITVAQDGLDDTIDLTVRGLDELRASVDAAGGTLNTANIAAQYSTIHIDAEVTLEGTAPARFAAVALLDVDAAIVGDGATTNGTGGGGSGPGGCDGGAAETPGDCTQAGGRAGGASAGGGGGGHATMGDQGAGGGGPGGEDRGSNELVPLADEAGNGGGGGGPGAIAGAGGGGGGGGGIVELTSDGVLRIGDSANLSVEGGGGGGGTGSCALLDQHGGGGGGGSGGAVLIRARSQLVDEAAAVRLSVAGGARGNDGCNAGGNGADGRVRVDTPNADANPTFAGAALYRGPVVAPQTPAIATTSPMMIEVFGDSGTTYFVEREGGQRQMVTTGSDRSATANVDLTAGINRVCAIVRTDVSISSPEGTNCVNVAYVP